jgi:hypothetical protein
MSVVVAEQPVDVAALWRKLRYPVVLIVIALALITVLAAIGTQPNSGVLDPRNTAPDGGHALSVLLTARGTPVTVATTLSQIDDSATATVVVSAPSMLSDQAIAALAATSATVVLLAPSDATLRRFGVAATVDAAVSTATVPPSCQLPAATTAGSVQIEGDLYAAGPGVQSCYLQQADAALLTTTRPAGGGRTIAFGSPASLTNARLATGGNAALGLGLLTNSRVQWVAGALDTAPLPATRRGLFHLLPARLLWATLQLFIAVVVVALWRGRRLGRPVVEPLPVVVRAAETVEGRARLMHAAKARGTAARALRSAALRRLGRGLRLGADEDPDSVIGLVAERTRTSATEVRAVLYGGEPADDAALVRLAQELPKLEIAVRQDDAGRSGGQP